MFSVALSHNDFEELRRTLFTEDGLENATFALCGFSTNDQDTQLLVRRLIAVPKEAYRSRSLNHLEVSPSYINSVLDEAKNRFALLVVHSHPGNLTPDYSISDDFGESRLFEVFSALIPAAPHASLLFSDQGIKGRYWTGKGFRNINHLRITGRELANVIVSKSRTAHLKRARFAVFDRQIIAFGEQMQERLNTLRVGIVGVGGTGSCVAEQLCRMGVSDFTLVDYDHFEPSNITRMYGTNQGDLGRKGPKVHLVARNLRTINETVQVKEIKESVVFQRILLKLTDCDVIFSCTDNDWSRSLLNRLAFQYMIPVIDMGVRISVQNGRIGGVGGRVTLVGPDTPCLWCSFHLDSERIRVESMDTLEREKLVKEKYVEGLPTNAPAVVSLNSTLAGLGVTLLLSMLSPFSSVPAEFCDQIYDGVAGIVFTSKAVTDPQCLVCGPNGLKGLGDLQIISSF